jgi:hypothetical protein
MKKPIDWPEDGLRELDDDSKDTPADSETLEDQHEKKLKAKKAARKVKVKKLMAPSFGDAGNITQHIVFLAWLMLNNPKLYLEFERIADATWQANPGRELSPTFIWATLRQYSRTATEGDQFAVNNNGLPFVSRMYALARPDRKIAMRDCWLDHLNDAEIALLPPFKPYRFGL